MIGYLKNLPLETLKLSFENSQSVLSNPLGILNLKC
jgi:hypothetical protein